MSATQGMDPTRVRAAARELDEHANSCDTSRLRATQLINDMPWEGVDAAGLTREWTSEGSPSLESFAELLRGIAETARLNAAAQEQTSRDLDGEGAGTGSGGSGSGNAGSGNDGGGTPDNKAWTRDGTVDSSREANDLVQALQDMSPEDARAVWDSLTPEEQAQVLTATGEDGMPLAGELARLEGVFSPEDIAAFNQSVLETHLGGSAVNTQTTRREVEADAVIVKGNLNSQTSVTQNADGTYSVTVSLGAGGGVEGTVSGVDVGLAGGATQNVAYSFASEEEARAFAEAARAELQGINIGDVANIITDPVGYLEDNIAPAAGEATSERIYDQQEVSLTAGAGVEEDGLSAGVEAGVTLTRETNNSFDGETYSGELSFSAEAGAEADGLNAGASAGASVSVAVANDGDGNARQVTLVMSGQAALEGGFVAEGDVEGAGGVGVSAEGTVTVTIPINEHTAGVQDDFNTALRTGNMELLQSAAQGAYSESVIRIDSSVTTEASASSSSWGVTDTTTESETTHGPVIIKVPGETEFQSSEDLQPTNGSTSGGW